MRIAVLRVSLREFGIGRYSGRRSQFQILQHKRLIDGKELDGVGTGRKSKLIGVGYKAGRILSFHGLILEYLHLSGGKLIAGGVG